LRPKAPRQQAEVQAVADLAAVPHQVVPAAVTEEPDTVEAVTREASQEAAAAQDLAAAVDGRIRLDSEAQAGHQLVDPAAGPWWRARSAPSMARKLRLHNRAGTSSADQAVAAELLSIQAPEVSGSSLRQPVPMRRLQEPRLLV
jgi:hypothetical protein